VGSRSRSDFLEANSVRVESEHDRCLDIAGMRVVGIDERRRPHKNRVTLTLQSITSLLEIFDISPVTVDDHHTSRPVGGAHELDQHFDDC
jgi:hypothetical protein